MGKGILLEVDGRQATVLTPQGEFRRVSVPRGTWEVGDEIDFADARPNPWARWWLAAAAALALFILPAGYRGWALAQPVALVTIDINPSVELTLNQREQVLMARGLNEDGVQLLEAVQWKRRPVEEVVAAITAEAVTEKKLDLADAASAVVVAVAPAEGRALDPKEAEEIAVQTRTAITEAVTDQGKALNIIPQTQVPVLQATSEEREEAREAGLTPGQYLLLEEIRQTVPEVDVEQLKELGPGKLLKQLQLNPGEVFQEAERHHGGKGKRQGDDDDDDAAPAVKPSDVTSPAEGAGPDGDPPVLPADDSEDTGDLDDEEKGKPDDKGRPVDKGKPDDTGKPADNGKPEDKGKPDDAGQPEEKGKPEDRGNAEGKGKPEERGKPDDDDEPDDRGEPDGLPGTGSSGNSGQGTKPGNGNKPGNSQGNNSGNDKGNDMGDDRGSDKDDDEEDDRGNSAGNEKKDDRGNGKGKD